MGLKLVILINLFLVGSYWVKRYLIIYLTAILSFNAVNGLTHPPVVYLG